MSAGIILIITVVSHIAELFSIRQWELHFVIFKRYIV